MASIINKILTDFHKLAIQKLDQTQRQEENQIAADDFKIKHIRQMGEFFLQIALFDCLEQHKQQLKDKSLFQFINRLVYSGLEQKFQIGKSTLDLRLGLYAKAKLQQNSDYNQIKKQLRVLVYQIQQRQFENVVRSVSTTVFQQSEYQEHILPHSMLDQIQDLLHQQDSNQAYQCVSQVSKKEVPKVQVETQMTEEIKQYLRKICYPQEELNYLCQHMDWKNPGYSSNPKGSNFIFSCKVQAKITQEKLQMVSHADAKNKREGKFLTAFKMLKNIYLSYPLIWKQFKRIKEKKNINISMTNQNKELLQKIQNEQKQQKQLKQQKKLKNDKQLRAKVQQYLNGVVSKKSQLSYVRKTYNKMIGEPKHQKIQNKNLWIVESSITVTNNPGKTKGSVPRLFNKQTAINY